MKKFRYLGDGLFLLCCCLYAFNRWYVKPRVQSPFMLFHFNDTLLIPCALPVLLFMQRRLKLRMTDELPTAGEIVLHLVVWSILFEAIGPHIMPGVVGDPWDVVSYTAGGILAWFWWHRTRFLPLRTGHEL